MTKLGACTAIATLLLTCGCASLQGHRDAPLASPSAADRAKAEAFRRGVVDHDAVALAKLTGMAWTPDRLPKDEAGYFFGPPETGGPSVRDILATPGIVTLIYRRPQSSLVGVMYVKPQYRGKAADKAFLRERMMKDFVYCEFEPVAGQWRLSDNMCFAGQDNPFEEPYG